jgi:exopolysaccharide biosynthesis polyprenyl glycosylphosphotransferase
MLRRDLHIRMQMHQLTDACLFGFSFWAANLLRVNPAIIDWFNFGVIPPESFNNIIWLYFALIPIAPLVLESQGFYNRPVTGPRNAVLWPLLKGVLLITFGLVLTTYTFHLLIPRGVAFFFGFISFSLIIIKEEIIRGYMSSHLAQSQYKRRFVLVGIEREIARIRQELTERADHSVSIVAEVNLVETPVQQLVAELHNHSVYGVILSAKHTNFEQVEYVIRACELEGVEVWLVADFFSTQISRTSLDELLGRPLLIFRTTPEASWRIVAKQVVDLVGSVILLLLFTFLFFIPIALAIRFTSPGPILFRQQRSGLNGRPFTIFKFRTMVTNAEQIKHELSAMNEMTGPVFKVTNDPRVTPVGKFLRKWSLDELPQIFNVLRGEMSLVGPRPLPVDEVKRFENLSHRRRLSVKPGLTCLWQVKGRNQINDFREWVRLDLEYIDNWSLGLDFKILLLTIPAVFRGTGAK